MIPKIEFYSSLECPYAYLLNFRLRQLWPEFKGRLTIVWRALALEFINSSGNSRSGFDEERGIFMQIEPGLRIKPWSRPNWDWPVTLWPAFEALACAQAQSSSAAFEMSWGLRSAIFSESRNIALRHEIFMVANQVARLAPFNMDLFGADWDSGRYKQSVVNDCQQGWHTLKVNGSATLILPDGSQETNPGIHASESQASADSQPAESAPSPSQLALLRSLLERAASS